MKVDFDQVVEKAADKPAFSNSTGWEYWHWDNCRGCVNEPNCPLIDVAMFGMTPAQWTDKGLQDYECSEFEAVP